MKETRDKMYEEVKDIVQQVSDSYVRRIMEDYLKHTGGYLVEYGESPFKVEVHYNGLDGLNGLESNLEPRKLE